MEFFFIASASLVFFLLRQRLEHHKAQKARDDEDHDGNCAGHAVVLARLEVIVEVHDERRRGAVRRSKRVGQHLRHIEHLQTADERRDDRIDKDRRQQWQRHLEKDLQRARAVNIRRLKQALVNAHDACHEQNCRVAEPHEEVHQADEPAHGKADVEKVDRRVDPAELRQDLVDRPDVGEQHIKQHRERRCHDEVRHINDGLKELLALDLQAVARKEAREHQRDHDLRDRTADPEHDRISGIFQDIARAVFIGRKERDVVFQADEIRPDLRQTLPVVFKKAVVDRQQLRRKVKQRIGQKERRDKNIAPLCVADFGPFGFQFGCFCRLHQNSSSYSQT